MPEQEKEKSQELGLIDITEILSDYLRIFRRMWAWVLIFTILGAGLFYVRARLQYQPVYTASATFTVNIQSRAYCKYISIYSDQWRIEAQGCEGYECKFRTGSN